MCMCAERLASVVWVGHVMVASTPRGGMDMYKRSTASSTSERRCEGWRGSESAVGTLRASSEVCALIL